MNGERSKWLEAPPPQNSMNCQWEHPKTRTGETIQRQSKIYMQELQAIYPRSNHTPQKTPLNISHYKV